MSDARLCAHIDSYKVDRAAVLAVEPPAATKSHIPLAHGRFLALIEERMKLAGMEISTSDFALSRDGMKMFGTYNLKAQDTTSNPDFGLAIGVRNSNNKAFPAGMAFGSRVFVCDNMAFSAEYVIKRRHTVRLLACLPGMIAEGLSRFKVADKEQTEDFTMWKSLDLHKINIKQTLTKAVDLGIMPTRSIDPVINEFRDPRFKEFKEHNGNMWGLFNAMTTHHRHDRDIRPDARYEALLGTHRFIKEEAKLILN